MVDLPFEDRTDFEDADRGLIAALDPGVVKDATGRVVWDNDAWAFLQEECPKTANPSLWRQSQLCARQGLFEVTDSIYQVRGLDLSNMTIVEGDHGVIVIDPLISTETAAAALALYRQHRGDRPVTGVIYTHSHGDHFGGVRGVVTGGVPILAPAGFLEHAVEENVYAGTAMNRRAVYMYGAELGKTPVGQIGAGLGMTTSTGTVSLIPPTVDITHTGQQEPLEKSLPNFDLKRLPAKAARQLRTLLDGSFLERKENVLVFGNPGSGKSHFLTALAQELVVVKERKMHFTKCALLMQDLLAAKRDLRLSREIKRLSRYDGLIIDDLGYLQQSRDDMEVVFTSLAERYDAVAS